MDELEHEAAAPLYERLVSTASKEWDLVRELEIQGNFDMANKVKEVAEHESKDLPVEYRSKLKIPALLVGRAHR